MKLALHRSLKFWSGILVMAFICWAWMDSQSHGSYFHVAKYSLGSRANGAFATRTPPAKEWFSIFRGTEIREWEALPRPFFVRGGGEYVDEADEAETSFRADTAFILSNQGTEEWVLFVPFWLILPALAVVWLALLLWRTWHRKCIVAP